MPHESSTSSCRARRVQSTECAENSSLECWDPARISTCFRPSIQQSQQCRSKILTRTEQHSRELVSMSCTKNTLIYYGLTWASTCFGGGLQSELHCLGNVPLPAMMTSPESTSTFPRPPMRKLVCGDSEVAIPTHPPRHSPYTMVGNNQMP